MRLHPLQGGLRLAGRKQAAEAPIRHCPLPDRLWLPLVQHAGPAGRLCVEAGQTVAAGQALSIAEDERAVPVHAPCAAEVIAIERRAIIHPGAVAEWHVGLRRLPASLSTSLPVLDAQHADAETLRLRLREAGIAGMGGAGFPTFEKLHVARRTLIINGAECEPYIACDDRLLRERAADVVAGAFLLQRLVGAERLLFAVEDCMQAATAALQAALAQRSGFELVCVPSVYPQGGERQLIRVLTGIDVPLGGLPREVGMLVLNVATAAASWRAVAHGEALTRRLISVAGAGVAQCGVFDVALGSSIADLIAAAGGYTPAAKRLIVGGPLMGTALPHDDFAIGKTCNSVLVLGAEEIGPAEPAMPCIRCGDCASACPAGLLPQQLHAFAQSAHWERLRDHGIAACIECACCDLVCPSHIPLAQQFRFAKAELRSRDLGAQRAAAAKNRFEAREQRIQRDLAEREARMAAKRKTLRSSAAQAQQQSRLAADHDGDSA